MRPLCCVSAMLTCVPRASTMTVSPRLPMSSVERADRQPLAGAEDDVLAFERAEAVQLDSHGVAARLQVGDLEVAVAVADRDARVVGGFVDDRHRGARNHLALRVGDVAGDRAGHGLGRGASVGAGRPERPSRLRRGKSSLDQTRALSCACLLRVNPPLIFQFGERYRTQFTAVNGWRYFVMWNAEGGIRQSAKGNGESGPLSAGA